MLHPSTFEYLQPTLDQIRDMTEARWAAATYAKELARLVPEGPDRTYIIRRLREVAMWVNVAITRNSDGSPRGPLEVDVKDYPFDHPVKGDLGSIPL